MLEIDNPELFRTIVESLPTGIYLVDRNRKILFWNRGAEKITGYKVHEVLGHNCSDNILAHCQEHGCDLCGSACPLADGMHEGRSRQSRVYFRHHDGHRLPVQVWTIPIRDSSGSVVGLAESFEDLRNQAAENRQEQSSLHIHLDQVSRVPDHATSEFVLNENLARFSLHHVDFGVLLIRVNEFETISASHGREAGRMLIRLSAETVSEALSPSHFLGRWSDSDFVVVALNTNSARLADLEQRLLRLAGHIELRWWGDEVPVTTSLGSTVVHTGDTVESLLQRAAPNRRVLVTSTSATHKS